MIAIPTNRLGMFFVRVQVGRVLLPGCHGPTPPGAQHPLNAVFVQGMPGRQHVRLKVHGYRSLPRQRAMSMEHKGVYQGIRGRTPEKMQPGALRRAEKGKRESWEKVMCR